MSDVATGHTQAKPASCRCPDTTLDHLIATQALRTPDAAAVRQWEVILTYRQLLDAAALLGQRLRAEGARPETHVGVCTRRSPDMIIAMVGVLLSGAAYVPLDTSHPAGRLAAILDDAHAQLAVVDAAGRELIRRTGRKLIEVTQAQPAGTPDGAAGGTGGDAADHAGRTPRPGNAAYVMYTSGSTGRPKGVVVTHRNVVAFASHVVERFRLDAGCRSIGFASLGFDVSVADIFVPLICGGSVQLIPEGDRIDPARLQRFLEWHRVTWGVLAPALLPLLEPARLTDLADILTAGEPPGPEQVARWSRPGQRRFHNWYGPTETTVCVTGGEFEGGWDQPLPIGRALAGCRAYVLDERMQPCAPGVAGELCIGGPQLARGYLGQPGHTGDVFVPDPVSGEPGARLYRTGDRAMWRPDGMIAYLGRLDRQVKIHGQRVEIGEIEAVLKGHPGIRQAVVDVRATAAGVKQVVAYLAPAGAPDLDELRRHCAQRLPAFMVPTRVVRVEALPLTASGKVDLRALSERAPVQAWRPGGSPRGAPEAADGTAQSVTRVAWAEVFDSALPQPNDDFFASGGHSILAMRLVATLRGRTGRRITVEDVYTGRTVAGLAERLAAATVDPAHNADNSDDANSALTSPPPGLSAAQRRIWFVEQLAPGTPAHNIALAERLRGTIDVAALRRALCGAAKRHEVLRWRIGQIDGVPRVIVDAPADVALTVDDLAGLTGGRQDGALRELLDREARTPFDLGAGPLWRARLFRLGPRDHVLAITLHHVVFDGWSVPVLYRDLELLYRGAEPAPLAASFTDYVTWLRQRVAALPPEAAAWWARHLGGAATAVDLPRDRPRPPIQTFRGASASATVGAGTTNRVRQLATDAGATLFAALLAAFGHLAGRLTGLDDLIIGTPLADRRNAAFDQVAGLLLHIVPLRLRVGGEISFARLLRHCRDETAAAFAHADTPFERIVESLGGHRDLSRNPLIQLLFNMYDFATPKLRLPGISAEPVPAGLPGSLFDLTLYVSEHREGLALRAVYNPDLYDAARIGALLASYVHLLGRCAAEPDRPLREISLRPAGSGLPGWATTLPRWDGAGIIERVREAARARPDAVAASGPGGVLRYRDMEAIRARTAAAVRNAGAAPGDAVAVLAARDARLPAILLGVLAAGVRWLIADPGLPDGALARQVAAARPRALVCCDPHGVIPAALRGLPVVQPAHSAAGAARRECEPPQGRCPDAPMPDRGYILLTSGTTGEPNAVITSERPLAHFAAWYTAAFSLRPADRFAMLSGLAHDPLLRDIFIPLVLGARLCVPSSDVLRDPARLLAWLRDEQITVTHLTPQLARLLALAPAGKAGKLMLRLAALGGDQGSAADVAALRALAPRARVVNFYGTTETPQAQACYEAPPGPGDRLTGQHDDPLPVGHGIDGALLLVLGPGGQPAAVGELGEVTIRSRYLATGYSDPGLTRRRFGVTPGGDPDDRFFRSGDLGRYRPDGTVVLAGRADNQVKVRGFRVEIGEIEAVLAAQSGVRQACVMVAGAGEQSRLHAYVVPARPGISAQELVGGLRQQLPDYAVPAGITLLPRLPLTPNAKVDRTALPQPALAPRTEPASALSGRTEHIIAGTWREVLGLPAVGAAENFFDIGGHSLAAATVQAKLAERLGKRIPVLDLFRYPTIRALAAHLDGRAPDPVFDRAAHRAAQRRWRARRSSTPATGEGGQR